MDRAQRLARKAEEKTAELHGGRITPGSGSRKHTKNDVANATWSYEVKSTSQKGYRLTLDDLIKAERGAAQEGHRMAFLIEYVGGIRAAYPRSARYVTVTEADFIEREQELEHLREIEWMYNDLRDS